MKTDFVLDHKPNLIRGEIHTNTKSDKLIIFSHGFGVKRYSWGMFQDIGEKLKDNFALVYFDYNFIDESGNTHTYSLRNQATILEKVIAHAQQKLSPKNITIIAHSMGCAVAAMSKLNNIEHTLLLAGPIESPYKTLVEYFSARPETKINESGRSIIKRSDGSLTYVDKGFWQDLKHVDPATSYNSLLQFSKVSYISPTKDQVICRQDLAKLDSQVTTYQIAADHDFTGDARHILVDTIMQITAG